MHAMPDETVPLFRKGKQLCVDLRTRADMAPDVSEGWRAELAKALDADRLVFATSTGYTLREQGKESSRAPIDSSGWSRSGSAGRCRPIKPGREP